MNSLAAAQDFDPCRSQSGLVYLTWTTLLFQSADAWTVEEATVSYARCQAEALQHRTEVSRSRADTGSVVICISLYDVNDGDIPEGIRRVRESGSSKKNRGLTPSIRRASAANSAC